MKKDMRWWRDASDGDDDDGGGMKALSKHLDAIETLMIIWLCGGGHGPHLRSR
jgi:hypothetical protein